MKTRIESWVQNSLRRLGVDIKYVNRGYNNPKMYINSLTGAISVKKPFNIIQVGANDGKYNDPIYDFVKEYKNATNIMLVEPLETVRPYLEEHYSYHPSVEIVNKAIGDQESSSIQLYGIKKKYWDDIDVGYGDSWPNYRVPTGVTTKNKNQMLRWISENVRSDSNPKNIIQKFDVKIANPNSLINKSDIMDDVQLLQIDTEGMDDKIVYSFFESDIEPNIINIECEYLNKEKQMKYDQKLQGKGYKVFNYTPNEKLAMK